MPLFTLQSLCPEHPLEDPKSDWKSARRVGQYRVSDRAVYFPAFPGTRYLSFDALTRAWSQKTSVPLTGCCGKELPMVLVRMEYAGGFYQDFSFEKQTEADRVLSQVRTRRPELFQEVPA